MTWTIFFRPPLVPGGAIARALRRDRKIILDFVPKCGIHGFRSAERGFLGNVVQLHHFIEERILPRKIMRNRAASPPLHPPGCRACPRS